MSDKKQKLIKEKYSTKGSSYWGILIFGLLLLVDLLTKLLADVYFNTPGAKAQIDIIPGWISLRMEYNPGISYGMGATAPEWVKLLVVIATAILMAGIAVAYFRIDKRRYLLRIALVFIVAGGVGNLIDRVYYRVWELDGTQLNQGVRDMVDLSRFGFAVCNFADFFITGGAVMLVLSLLFFDRDAIWPMTERYKILAKEHEEEQEAKKAAQKAAQGDALSDDKDAKQAEEGIETKQNTDGQENG